MTPSLFVGPWRLADLPQITPNGLRVFSCFACGGGSTMGYKLAGYDVLGGLELDPAMAALYRANHRPRFLFTEAIQTFRHMEALPLELSQLDVLDGSPPCSVFSLAGKRSKKWGIEARFREGQATQRLDDLFLHFIALARRLQPRVVVAENVKGLMLGKARGYVSEIFRALRLAGFRPALFLLNAARMGVPQARERTFFVAVREDLAATLPRLQLAFTESVTTAAEALVGLPPQQGPALTGQIARYYARTPPGRNFSYAHPRGSMYTLCRLAPDQPARTITASCGIYHWTEPRRISQAEAARLQTFPDDYDAGAEDLRYVAGMSVPPFMMQRVALELGRQIFGIPYDRTRRPLCPPATASSTPPTSQLAA